MMGFARKLPPAGPWEAVGEYMSEANHSPAVTPDHLDDSRTRMKKE